MEQTEFEQIARSTRAKAVATALAYSVGKEEAGDVAQEVMLKLWTLHGDIDSREDMEGRVNQRVQHYEIFLKKTSAGVEKLSFSLGLALIFFLILVIFPSVTVLMSVPFGIYCRISLLPFSMAPFCHAQ